MLLPWGIGRRSRRFVHENGIVMFLVALVAGVVLLVALLMYALST
ncbi:MAG TPA: hypothetical protein VG167_17415 [Verrucomicrobiae bacterium]|nr:hypothetical protein [Verrucomicrobiae bacterium]